MCAGKLRFFAKVVRFPLAENLRFDAPEYGRFGLTPSGQEIRFPDGDTAPRHRSFDDTYRNTYGLM